MNVSMLDQIRRTIQRYRMFEPGDRVVVAVSGGPDSVCLLSALSRLNARLCLKIVVAHLDHGLRKGSAEDLAFVKKMSESSGFPFYSKTIVLNKTKLQASLEDFLRKKRYEFLLGVCKKTGSAKLALGHTKDDQAETVLMRVIRGSGLYGLSAILPKRQVKPGEVVRPLIEVSRDDVMDFLKKNGIRFRVDATNKEERFLRNKIRSRLLPLLEKEYNPNIKETLSRLALAVGADYELLQSQALNFFNKYTRRSGRRVSVSAESLKRLDISLRRLVLRNILGEIQGDLKKLGFEHWEEIDDLLFSRPVCSEVHLPNGVIVSKTGKSLDIFKR
jgi:tRNA(Ile)-lysidine synthase